MNQEKTNEEQHRDNTGSKMGMWLFLFTEMLLFGGMFLLYSVYRSENPINFHQAAFELSTAAGTINTLILITSSLTMALSISAIQKGDKKLSKAFLVMTIIFGLLFLVIKYFEWGAKLHHGIYPNSPGLLEREQGEILFFSLYFIMTGLHGLHVLVGIFLLSFMLFFMVRETIGQNDFIKLENSGLYWHLVDIVWIFLFPLFYLIT